MAGERMRPPAHGWARPEAQQSTDLTERSDTGRHVPVTERATWGRRPAAAGGPPLTGQRIGYSPLAGGRGGHRFAAAAGKHCLPQAGDLGAAAGSTPARQHGSAAGNT